MINSFHPGLLMILIGMLILVLQDRFKKPCSIIAAASGILGLFTLNSSSNLVYQITPGIKLEMIHVDGLSMMFVIIFGIITVINAIYSFDIQDKWEKGVSVIYGGSIISATLAGDVISMIVFWEVAAFSAAYLIYARHTRRSSRSALRYLLMHAFGGNMLLVGFLLHAAQTNSLEIPRFTALGGSAAFWFILIGVGVNAVVPPFNSWISDSYPESTIAGTVYMCGYTTKLGIYAMIRIFSGTEALVYVGVFMALYGVLMAFLENDLRRLFSYHIMSQLGYMVAALAIGGAWGIDGAVSHAFNNILYKGVLMMCSGAVIMATGKRKITELGGLSKKMPITAWTFFIASLSIAGIPFLNGFASKSIIMHAVNLGGHETAALLLTVTSIGTWLSVALKVNWFVFFDKARSEFEVKPIPMCMKIGMILGASGCIILGVYPSLLFRIMPYKIDVNPFNIGHILEYMILFAGATLVFWIFRVKILPHDELSLDFDWFFRKPLAKFVNCVSVGLNRFTAWVDSKSLNFVHFLGERLGNPYKWTENSRNSAIRNISFENEDRDIGVVIEISVSMFALILMIAMIYIN
nr:proton-conducting transporter membrane subunit [uncultured Mogibacterium sp.]